MRLFLLAVFSTVILGMIGLMAMPAHAQAFSKVDCAGTNLGAPAGIQFDCWQEGPDNGGAVGTSCQFFGYQAAIPANVDEPHFFIQLRQAPSPKCGVQMPHGPADTMQHQTKFVNEQANNWSAVQAIDADTNVMFFDAKNQKQEGKCFAFTKLGPSRGTVGRAYWMFGYFCKRPGQPVDAAVAATTINGIGIKSDVAATESPASARAGCDVPFFKTVGGQKTPIGSKHIEEGGTYTRAGDMQLMVCRNGKVVKAP